MEPIDYKTLYESLQNENNKLRDELSEKASIIQILYSDMDDINQQLVHYKEMFSAANTNLMDNDKKVYDLNEENNKIRNENFELKHILNTHKQEILELKKLNESNNKFINSQYKITNANANTNTNILLQKVTQKDTLLQKVTQKDTLLQKVTQKNTETTSDIVEITSDIANTQLERYELLPIDIITKWLIDYINSGCTFAIMSEHHLDINIKSSYNSEKIINSRKTFKNNKWTLRVILKLFFMYHFPSQLKYLYSNKKIQVTLVLYVILK